MDVNGTRFHLILSRQEWLACRVLEAGSGAGGVAWDAKSAALTLDRAFARFPRSRRDAPLSPDARRGAGVDSYGNWFWIGHDRRSIHWRPAGSARSSLCWQPGAEPPETAPPTNTAGEFGPARPPRPERVELEGLAVTQDHYLVVGERVQAGLLLFDLHAGGPPIRLAFPEGVAITPVDIAPAPDGGVWILDREQRLVWGLDRRFRIIAEPPSPEGPLQVELDFQPLSGDAQFLSVPVPPEGFPIPETGWPVALTALPDGSLLVLDSPPGAPCSQIFHYRFSQLLGVYPLQDEVEVTTVGGGAEVEALFITGHDLAYNAADGLIYVVERDGNQAVALKLEPDASPPRFSILRDYFPMQSHGGRALAEGPGGVFYDVTGGRPDDDRFVRWVRLQAVSLPAYDRYAEILAGALEPDATADVTPVFDGKLRDTIWHRLLLDACIPAEAGVAVWTRAHNDRLLLESLPFQPEPELYLRGTGAEIPYYDPYPDQDELPNRTGTWELLFQRAQGRFLQVKLVLTGNSRVTPFLRSLRLYYPRLSYPQRYLPAIYRDDSTPGPFLDRLLANMEGTYTEIEGKMQRVPVLFDPRSAPPEALDWLAGWLGLALDPLWARLQQERQPAVPGSRSRPPDRRRLLIRFARKLYERRGTPDGIQFALLLLLDPCLERLMERLKDAAVRPTHPLRLELARYSLPAPGPATTELELEDLLYDYALSRPSPVRLVERFLIRRGLALVSGDPSAGEPASGNPVESGFQVYAHRFTVLIPVGLTVEEEGMVTRLIGLEKPAHTQFEVRRYFDGFRIAEARLGIDTTLDRTNRFTDLILGRNYLSEGYLESDHPMSVRERLVSDRDRLGKIPPL